MVEQTDLEEQYLLRVHDKELSENIRSALKEPIDSPRFQGPSLELTFTSQDGVDPEARTGEFIFEGEKYSAKRQDLPTVVECFKTYDKINLVKSADVGQVIVIPDKHQASSSEIEARNGVTPPMRDARKRRFRTPRIVDPNLMRQVEDAVLLIAAGQAPEGYQFIDEEEEYIVSEDGRSGSWQPFQPGRVNKAEETQKKPAAKRKKKKAEAADPTPSQDGGETIDMEEI